MLSRLQTVILCHEWTHTDRQTERGQAYIYTEILAGFHDGRGKEGNRVTTPFGQFLRDAIWTSASLNPT